MLVDGQTLNLILNHETQMQTQVSTTTTSSSKDQFVLYAGEDFEHVSANVILTGTDDAVTPRRGVIDLRSDFIIRRHSEEYSGQRAWIGTMRPASPRSLESLEFLESSKRKKEQVLTLGAALCAPRAA